MGRCSPAKTTRRLKHRRSIAHAEVKPNTKGRRGTAYVKRAALLKHVETAAVCQREAHGANGKIRVRTATL